MANLPSQDELLLRELRDARTRLMKRPYYNKSLVGSLSQRIFLLERKLGIPMPKATESAETGAQPEAKTQNDGGADVAPDAEAKTAAKPRARAKAKAKVEMGAEAPAEAEAAA